MNRTKYVATLAVSLLLASTCRPALAIDVIFTFDSSAALTLSGYADDGSGDIIPGVPQQPGSDVSPVIGHFVVSFDPTSSSPGTLQFESGKGAYVAMGNSIANASPGGTPANAAISISGVDLAFRNVTWEMSSAPLAVSNSQYQAGDVLYTTLSGSLDTNIGIANVTGSTGPMTTSDFGSLVQTSPGNWSLSLPVSVPLSSPPLYGSVAGLLHATAQFSSDNLATVSTPTQPTSVLGGLGTIGGVQAQFSEGTTPGTFAAQQISSLSGLPLAAVSGLANFGITSLSQDVQIWDLQYTGAISGPVTVTVAYDPSRLTPAERADPSILRIEHYNTVIGAWESLPILNVTDSTITFTTTSFSDVMMVPEPATAVLAALGGLAVVALRRRQR